MSDKIGPFSIMMIRGKIDLIDKLKKGIVSASPLGKFEFSDLLKVVFGKFIDLDRRMLSDDLGHNYGSVCRWVAGQTAPHQALWPGIISWIQGSLDKKRDELQALLVM